MLLIQAEAMEDSKGREIIDRQEDGRNHVGEDSDEESRNKDNLYLWCDGLGQNLSKEVASNGDECFS
jgi:hypothetical protein